MHSPISLLSIVFNTTPSQNKGLHHSISYPKTSFRQQVRTMSADISCQGGSIRREEIRVSDAKASHTAVSRADSPPSFSGAEGI